MLLKTALLVDSGTWLPSQNPYIHIHSPPLPRTPFYARINTYMHVCVCVSLCMHEHKYVQEYVYVLADMHLYVHVLVPMGVRG